MSSFLELINDTPVSSKTITITDNDQTGVKGLMLKITPMGSKYFYFKYDMQGTTKTVKLGGQMSLTQAREIAQALRTKVILGEDPARAWNKLTGEPTLDQLFQTLLKERWSDPRFIKSKRYREVQNIYGARISRTFGDRRASTLTVEEITRWHKSISMAKKVMANRSWEVLRTVIEYAVSLNWCDKVPKIKQNPERTRTRVPSKEELTVLLNALNEMARDKTNKRQATAIYLIALMYTGCRPMMLAECRWDHIVYEGPEGVKLSLQGKMSYKFHQDETVVVPQQILDLLKDAPKDRGGKMFCTKGSRALWHSLTDKYKIVDLWKRDLRKAFASLGLSKGIPIDLIGSALNHRSAQTTKIYAKEFDNGTVKTTATIASGFDELLGDL
jgi:integrase